MSAHANPNIITDGLAFMYDTDDSKSYKGQPATNLITSGLPGYFGSGGETLYQKSLYGLESDSGVFQRNYVTNPATSDSSTFNNNGGLYKNFSTSTLNANTEYIQVSFDFYLITPYVRFGSSGTGLNGYMQIRSTDNTTNNYGWDTRYSNGSGDDWNNSSNYVGTWQRVSLIIDITADKTPQDISAMYIYYDRFTQGEGIFTNFIITEHVTLPSSPVSYTSGTRSDTQSIIDRTGNTTIDLSNVSFDSNEQITLDGTNDYIDLGSDVSISPDNQGWTTEYWFNTNSAGTLQHFNSAENDEFNANWLAIYNSKLAVWNRSPGYWKYGDTIIQSNTWYQAVFICDSGGTNMRFYINGKAEGGTHVGNSWNATYSSLDVRYIGKYEYNGGHSRYFNGEIEAVKIYNRALTSAEVLQNFNATKSRFGL